VTIDGGWIERFVKMMGCQAIIFLSLVTFGMGLLF